MEELKNSNNINLLFLGSKKMLESKLNIEIKTEDENNKLKKNINLIVNRIYNSINIEKDTDLKKLNLICLTHIKNIYVNKDIENNDNVNKKDNDDNENENENEKKLDRDILDFKVQELEKKRNYEPDYNIIINKREIEKKEEENNKKEKTNTIINYNNSSINIDYKSYILSSSKRDWIINNYINDLNYDLNILDIKYKNLKFKPQIICLPYYISLLTPSLNIKINNIYTYNFVCCFKNTEWDTWKTDDTHNFELNNNIINIKLYDSNNNLLDLGIDNIEIEKVLLKNNNIYKIWSKKDYIYDFKNKYSKNNIIFIRNKNGKIFQKKVINIEENENNNIIEIFDNKNELEIKDFENSNYINYKNQYSLLINYYTK